MARTLSIKEAKQRAGRFCALRERSPKEVLDKLQSWGLDPEASTNVLQELTNEKYVDEQRFADAYCHDKFEFNSWGKQKIKATIFVHQLSEHVVLNALNRIDSSKYEERLMELGRKKWEQLRNEEVIKRKHKTVNYLANKGFELDLIWKTISQLELKGL